MLKRVYFFVILIVALLGSCKDNDNPPNFKVTGVYAGNTEISTSGTATNIPLDQSFVLVFSSAVNSGTVSDGVSLNIAANVVPTSLNISSDKKSVSIFPQSLLTANTTYTISISDKLKGSEGQSITPVDVSFKTATQPLTITSLKIDGKTIATSEIPQEVALKPNIEITFSDALNPASISSYVSITGYGTTPVTVTLANDNKTLLVTPANNMAGLRKYKLNISSALQSASGQTFAGSAKDFYTTKDSELKFPVVSDDELLTMVQQRTFNYFWDFAESSSGMARERNTSGDLVTSGGSGFGLMAIIVGIERNFITRSQGLQRLDKILSFLESADRFHGAYSHWINGTTGKVIPFSSNDNGGDLVETAFLMEGLITFRQYLDPATESAYISRINSLYNAVEWDWYRQNDQNVLYWHWSPDKNWVMNFPIRGHNETLITYVLAASSPTHTIPASVYHEGYARNGDIQNGKQFYGITLPLGEDYGGPLFFTHYSFLGLDPRNLSDTYANYWTQNTNHSLINHAYAAANPKHYVGYSDENWGLTASDNNTGYSAHSPTNDLGVITPTAALSSFPYTPVESMKALKFFYYSLGDRLWGQYGFYDAFNLTAQWTADSYLAIDQGPIVVMVENYRSGLLWDLFMSAPEVQNGLTKLGFNY